MQGGRGELSRTGVDPNCCNLLHPVARQAAARPVARAFAVALVAGTFAGGCTQVYNHGYMVQEGALEQVHIGATQEQVLIVLGTPSTVATISGEVFYYISQQGSQTSFLPQKEIDRRIVAVYFDKSRRVERLADYGLKDGKIFDYISRTTPSGGVEQNFLGFAFKIFQSN
jgi:outer membrane protein assembly factor BamE (lipoprotein component of BamABCDE complex)